jgi:hypothetical protein
MTRKRIDNHSTEFGLWLREQNALDSSKGFIATNLDYMWKNYKNNLWMYLEEKRYNSVLRSPQIGLFLKADTSVQDENYKGFHLIVFEKTSPDDGAVFLDGKKITTEDLISFLRFEKPKEWYESYFSKNKNKTTANVGALAVATI